MISYLLEFSANGRRLTVHKTDSGAYLVEKHNGEDTFLLSDCAEFQDALAVFQGHVHEMTDALLMQELGK